MRTPFLLLVASHLINASAIGQAVSNSTDDRLDWWREARFGMFIHWGPVALKGTEIGWSRGREVPTAEYDQLYQRFNPTRFNANEWVALARDTGMRYLVFTSKHHDGFSMWDSEVSDYDIAATPFKRDVVKELAEACRASGITFCTYHSICDWWHPDYPLGSPGGKTTKASSNMPRYREYLKAQVAELIRGYGPLGVMWFDGEWESPWTEAMGSDLYEHCRSLQPSIIVNNRVGKARHGMEGTSREGVFAGDYDTPEQRVGQYQDDRPWESCITICHQWAWKPNDKLKSLKECVRTLVQCVGGDGNLLLNVGPMPDGRIEPRQAQRLREIGDWLKQHGESVYGTRGGPFRPGQWGASTRNANRIYLHLFEVDQRLELPALTRKVVGSRVLGAGQLKLSQTPEGITVSVLPASRQDVVTVVVLDLDGSAMDLPAVGVKPPGSHRR